jgi:hypothetical protein
VTSRLKTGKSVTFFTVWLPYWLVGWLAFWLAGWLPVGLILWDDRADLVERRIKTTPPHNDANKLLTEHK